MRGAILEITRSVTCHAAAYASEQVPCYRPLKGWRARHTNPKSGKRSIVFSLDQGYADRPVDVPCGSCVGCRLDRSREWAVRCVHEGQLHEENCMITLTYNEEHLPHDAGLCVSHFQDFMKRARFHLSPKKIRYFHCGEYGDENRRPHYHALIFGHDFAGPPDKRIVWEQREGVTTWLSAELESLWGKGFCTVGALTFDSAAYVARYVMKKVGGAAAYDHYLSVDPVTAEVFQIKPEYITMSRRPGIAADWFKRFKSDVYPHDYVVLTGGKKVKVPRYYDGRFSLDNQAAMLEIKSRRISEAHKRSADNTMERLETKEAVATLKVKNLSRKV